MKELILFDVKQSQEASKIIQSIQIKGCFIFTQFAVHYHMLLLCHFPIAQHVPVTKIAVPPPPPPIPVSEKAPCLHFDSISAFYSRPNSRCTNADMLTSPVLTTVPSPSLSSHSSDSKSLPKPLMQLSINSAGSRALK